MHYTYSLAAILTLSVLLCAGSGLFSLVVWYETEPRLGRPAWRTGLVVLYYLVMYVVYLGLVGMVFMRMTKLLGG